MAATYANNLNRSYKFLTEVVQRVHAKLNEGKNTIWEVTNEYQLRCIKLQIEALNSMTKQVKTELQAIDTAMNAVQKLLEIDDQDYRKEVEERVNPILENQHYLDVHQTAKIHLLEIEDLTVKLKEAEIRGTILMNETKEYTDPHKENSSQEILETLQQSFEGITLAIKRGSTTRGYSHFTLPTFNGTIEQFNSYWGRFKRTVDENNEYDLLEKVNLLCEGLSGEALQAIQGIEPSVNNYEQLKRILVEEFGSYTVNKVQLVNNLREVRKAPNKADECIKTLRQIKTIIRQLQAAGSFITPEFCLLEVTNKFPFHIVKSILIDESQNWEVEDILSTITRNVKTLQLRQNSEGLFPDPNSDKTSDNRKNEKKYNTIGQRINEERKIWPCLFCNNTDHRSHQCMKVDTVEGKRDILRKENRCWICFSPLHKSKDCKKDKCPLCKGDHNSIVCQKGKEDMIKKERISANVHLDELDELLPEGSNAEPTDEGHMMILSHTEPEKGLKPQQVLLRTAESKVLCNRTKQFKPIRILIDEGSMRSFIKADVAEALGVPHFNKKVRTFYGIGGLKSSNNSSEVQLVFHTKDGSIIYTNMITKPKLTEPIRSPNLTVQDKKFIAVNKLTLANPNVHGEVFEPDIILGMDRYRQFMEINNEIELPSRLVLKKSVFGYLLHGCPNELSHTPRSVSYTTIEESLAKEDDDNDIVRRLFEIDSLGINTEDHKIDQTNHYYQAYIKELRIENNRIFAPLPIKSNVTELKSNFYPSLYRLKSLWGKIQQNPEQRRWYKKTIEDYLANDIIEEVPTNEKSARQIFYLPHHGVWKSGKPKPLRIVFDGSAKQKDSPSLNEVIHTGLSYVNKIHDILVLARINPIIITCDIESAFLQIALKAEHKDLCRFLWVKNPEEPLSGKNIREFRFKRLPFGLTASPSVLNMCLTWFLTNSQLEIAGEILQCLYVDNIILFASSTTEAVRKCRLVKELFKGISMNVRQFLCNDEQVAKEIPEADQYPMKDISILGVPYKPKPDVLGVNLTTSPLSSLTKRGLLRHLHSLYDPIGIINPLTIKLKILLRKTCDERYGWDEILPEEITKEWKAIMEDIQSKLSINLKRSSEFKIHDTELWVFADASATALACCAYFKYPQGNSYLISGKSRLAPRNKTITIPRLELIAIRLASRLASAIQLLIPKLKEVVIVSDSAIALAWITNGKALPPYVTHQVREIHKTVNSIQGRGTKMSFYHIDTKRNPADIGSRGGNMQQLLESQWIYGPTWIKQYGNIRDCPFLTVCPMSPIQIEIQMIQVEKNEQSPLSVNLSYKESHYSNLRTLVKVAKTWRHWMKKVFPEKQCASDISKLSEDNHPTSHDVECIEKLLIKQAQENLNIKDLENRHKGFSFFLDENGIIRVKSRLQNAPIPYDTKNPIYVPRNSPYTEHLVMHYHRETHHQGKDFVAIRLRQAYFINKPSQTIKRVLRNCVVCRRFHSLPFGTPQMPSLPKDRVTITKPFINTGCDLMGPISLKNKEKCYVCLFTCMTTRAIHLEMVLDQSSKAFMNAFNRFISRRGIPEIMRSDGAGNFTLSAKMIDIFEQCNEQDLTTEGLVSYFATKRIRWLFNTPLAPWKGGCWERLVGIVKLALKKTIGRKTLNVDEFNTLLVKIEAILNTRPLTHPDPNEINRLPIRPMDFLNPILAFSLPDTNANTRIYPDGSSVPVIQTMEQAIEAIQLSSNATSQFWEIFLKEYLIYIKDVYKHARKQRNPASQLPQVGEVVIIQEDNLPRGSWKLGRIIELIQGSDKEIRSARVKTGTGNVITRSLSHLYSMEIRSTAPINPTVAKLNAGKYKTGPTNKNGTDPPTVAEQLLDSVTERTNKEKSRRADPNEYPTSEKTKEKTDSTRIPDSEPIIDEPILDINADSNIDKDTRDAQTEAGFDNITIDRRWWMPERIRKTTERLKRSRDCPRWLKQKVKTPTINKQFLLICCLIVVNLNTTEAKTSHCVDATLFSQKALANPHCNETVAWVTIMIPLIIACVVICCLCRIIKGERSHQTWSNSLRTMNKSFRQHITKHTTTTEERVETTTIEEGVIETERISTLNNQTEPKRLPQFMRMGSRLSLLMIVLAALNSPIQACRNAHVRHSTEIICNDELSCYKEYARDFVLSAKTKTVCLEFNYKNQSIGLIEVLGSKTRYTCQPTVHFYTKDTAPRIKSRKRCSSMGSCDDSCETMASNTTLQDLAPYRYPAQTGCRRSCGFIFCGCATWSDACVFYKLEHIPENEVIYKVISCDSWETEVELDVRTTFFNVKEQRILRIKPYETVQDKLFNLTMVSHTRPPVYGLHKEFAISEKKTFMVEKQKIMINCQTQEQAIKSFDNCTVTKHCDCVVDRNEAAACHCPFHRFTTKENVLPLHPVEGTITTNGQNVIIEPMFDEGKYTIESSMLLDGHLMTNDFPCHPSFVNVTGCYACHTGAILITKCLSAEDTWIPLKCEKEVHMIKCGPKEPHTEINYYSHDAFVSEKCQSHCANVYKELEIIGTLNYATSQESIDFDKTKEKRSQKIDLTPLWKLMTGWKSQAVAFLLLITISSLAYMFSTHLMLWTLKIVEWAILSIYKIIIRGYKVGKLLLHEPDGQQAGQQA